MDSIQNVRKVFAWPQLRWLFISTFALAFGWSLFNEFIPVMLRERLRFTLSDIGNYYAVGGAWYAFCSGILTTAILKFFPPERIGGKALAGCALCMLMFLLADGKGWVFSILPFLMFGLAFTYPTTGAMVSNRAGKANQGEVLGVYQSVTGLAMGLSPLIVGSAIGMYPALTAIGGAIAMILASFAFRNGVKNTTQALPEQYSG
jgi:DHA1 family tetracycline resistance protein-like MFS transporter